MANHITLESVTSAFDTWRQTRGDLKARVPDSLRQLAIKLLPQHRPGRVIRALKINHSMLKQWQHENTPSTTAFLALPIQPPERAAACALQITLRNRLGAEMHISGALSLDQLTRLAHTFISSSGEAP